MIKMKKPLLCLLFLLMSKLVFSNVDSIGMESVDGKKYVIHRVEKSEGLYSIARKYGTTAKAIQESNSLTTTVLDLGQTLKVPYTSKINTPSSTKEVYEEVNPKPSIPTNPKSSVDIYATHVVKKGETLYAISQKYGTSLTELKKINNISQNTLEVGQKLKVPKKQSTVSNASESTNAEQKVSTRPNSYLNSVDYTENGVAGWINDKSINPDKSIALHKTAPIGTIMRVTNLMNNRSIYVKVIGTLPETGDNDNIIVILSKAAVKMLGATEQKFRVNINYSIPKD